MSFHLTQAERKYVRRHKRVQKHRDACCQVFFPLKDNAPNEIYSILTETLREHAPSYATVNNWVVQFTRGDFSTCIAPRPGRPKTVTNPKIIDQIHELIMKDRRPDFG
jgi:TPP-dependent 2-oxoacid decarboxylase